MTCQKCGSEALIDGVRIIDRGHYDQKRDLSATVYTNPGAMLFKGAVTTEISGRVCGSCGYVEFFVANPQELLAAAKDRSGK